MELKTKSGFAGHGRTGPAGATGLENQAFGDSVRSLSNIGLALMFVFFVCYLLGFPSAMVSVQDCAANWHKPLKEYLTAVSSPVGWSGWSSQRPGSDTLVFASMVFILSITGLAYLPIMPLLSKRGVLWFVLAVIQVLVLVVSASGLAIFH